MRFLRTDKPSSGRFNIRNQYPHDIISASVFNLGAFVINFNYTRVRGGINRTRIYVDIHRDIINVTNLYINHQY